MLATAKVSADRPSVTPAAAAANSRRTLATWTEACAPTMRRATMGFARAGGIEIGKLRDARAHARLQRSAVAGLRRDHRRAAGDGAWHRRYGGAADRHGLRQRLRGRQAGARGRA